MADLLPVDTTSPAVAALTPSGIARLDVTEAEVRVAAWNLAYPIGTWVVAYPGARGARGSRQLITQTRKAAALTRSGKPAVFLRGHGAYILLTHVDPITAAKAGELMEQRHQFLDLDTDSVPIEGACPYSYLRLGGQP